LNCDGVIRTVSSYIDGELEATVTQEFEVHVSGCEYCRLLVSQTKLTVSVFYDSDIVEFPEETRSRLHKNLRHKIREAKP
jgi:anti-sigma factor RsiW